MEWRSHSFPLERISSHRHPWAGDASMSSATAAAPSSYISVPSTIILAQDSPLQSPTQEEEQATQMVALLGSNPDNPDSRNELQVELQVDQAVTGGGDEPQVEASGTTLNRTYIFQWLGLMGATLSSTFTAFVLGGFGSFMPERMLWVCLGIVMVTPMVALGVRPSWRVIWKHLEEESDIVDFPSQPIGAGEGSGAVLKVSLALVLLIDVVIRWKDIHLSKACSYSCPRRAKESLLAIAIVILFLEGLPALIVRLDVKSRYHHVWLLMFRHILKDRSILIALGQREGKRLQSYQSSALSIVIVTTVGLLVGGNFGNFMTGTCFWICWTTLIAEALAEGIYRFPLRIPEVRTARGSSNGRSDHTEASGDAANVDSTSMSRHDGDDRPRSGWQHKAVSVFRGLVQGSLSICLMIIVKMEAFYPSGLPDSVCDKTCRRNTKDLLIATCACTIVQAVSLIQPAPVQSFSILFVLPLLLYSALVVAGSITMVASLLSLMVMVELGSVALGGITGGLVVYSLAWAGLVFLLMVYVVNPCLLRFGIDRSHFWKWCACIFGIVFVTLLIFVARLIFVALERTQIRSTHAE